MSKIAEQLKDEKENIAKKILNIIKEFENNNDCINITKVELAQRTMVSGAITTDKAIIHMEMY